MWSESERYWWNHLKYLPLSFSSGNGLLTRGTLAVDSTIIEQWNAHSSWNPQVLLFFCHPRLASRGNPSITGLFLAWDDQFSKWEFLITRQDATRMIWFNTRVWGAEADWIAESCPLKREKWAAASKPLLKLPPCPGSDGAEISGNCCICQVTSIFEKWDLERSTKSRKGRHKEAWRGRFEKSKPTTLFSPSLWHTSLFPFLVFPLKMSNTTCLIFWDGLEHEAASLGRAMAKFLALLQLFQLLVSFGLQTPSTRLAACSKFNSTHRTSHYHHWTTLAGCVSVIGHVVCLCVYVQNCCPLYGARWPSQALNPRLNSEPRPYRGLSEVDTTRGMLQERKSRLFPQRAVQIQFWAFRFFLVLLVRHFLKWFPCGGTLKPRSYFKALILTLSIIEQNFVAATLLGSDTRL